MGRACWRPRGTPVTCRASGWLPVRCNKVLTSPAAPQTHCTLQWKQLVTQVVADCWTTGRSCLTLDRLVLHALAAQQLWQTHVLGNAEQCRWLYANDDRSRSAHTGGGLEAGSYLVDNGGSSLQRSVVRLRRDHHIVRLQVLVVREVHCGLHGLHQLGDCTPQNRCSILNKQPAHRIISCEMHVPARVEPSTFQQQQWARSNDPKLALPRAAPATQNLPSSAARHLTQPQCKERWSDTWRLDDQLAPRVADFADDGLGAELQRRRRFVRLAHATQQRGHCRARRARNPSLLQERNRVLNLHRHINFLLKLH